MRRRKSELARVTSSARRMRHLRSVEDFDQRQDRLLKSRLRQQARRRKELVTDSLDNTVDLQKNDNIITNVVEVTMQEISSNEEDSDKQNEGDNSKQSEDREKLKEITSNELFITARSEESSEGVVWMAEVKIETIY